MAVLRAGVVEFLASKRYIHGKFYSVMKVIALTEFVAGPDGSIDMNKQITEAGRVLDDLHRRGILQTIYLRKDTPGTVMIINCGTEEDAHQYVKTLPGVAAGSTSYSLILLGSELPPGAFLGSRMAGS